MLISNKESVEKTRPLIGKRVFYFNIRPLPRFKKRIPLVMSMTKEQMIKENIIAVGKLERVNDEGIAYIRVSKLSANVVPTYDVYENKRDINLAELKRFIYKHLNRTPEQEEEDLKRIFSAWLY